MLIRSLVLGTGSVAVAALLAGCATQPTYSYYRVPCSVPGSQPASKVSGPNATSSAPSAGKQSSKDASAGTASQKTSTADQSPPAGSKNDGCIVAVRDRYPSYGYYPGAYYPYPYYFSSPYWNYPYWGGFGGGFYYGRGFNDHDRDDFRGGRRSR